MRQNAEKTTLAIEGLADGNTEQAAAAVGIAETTLRHRLKGGNTRAEAREAQQVLTCQEEKAW